MMAYNFRPELYGTMADLNHLHIIIVCLPRVPPYEFSKVGACHVMIDALVLLRIRSCARMGAKARGIQTIES